MFQELSQDIEKTIVFDKYKRDFRSIPYYLEVLIGERKFVPEHFRGAGYLNVRTPRIKLTAPELEYREQRAFPSSWPFSLPIEES